MRTIGASTMDGSILLNGKPTDADFRRRTAYCEQMETHEATQTVREDLRFSAYLRQSPQVSREEKDSSVEELIQLLEMEDFADASIGGQESGLSVEERKSLLELNWLQIRLNMSSSNTVGIAEIYLKGGIIVRVYVHGRQNY
jgi:ATP-binding cassette, subfamily G (WHITE), member 2, SNQ2